MCTLIDRQQDGDDAAPSCESGAVSLSLGSLRSSSRSWPGRCCLRLVGGWSWVLNLVFLCFSGPTVSTALSGFLVLCWGVLAECWGGAGWRGLGLCAAGGKGATAAVRSVDAQRRPTAELASSTNGTNRGVRWTARRAVGWDGNYNLEYAEAWG